MHLGFSRSRLALAPAGAHSVGIEVELENGDIPEPKRSLDMWEVKGDDSLRNGQELVTSMPVWKANLEECFAQFDTIIKSARGTPDASWRCSTHVHLDVRDMDSNQLMALMCAVALTDTVITKAHGREGSNFCVPYRSFNPVDQAFQKYTSAGLFRFKDLGTIEFRMFKGATNSDELRRIVDIVHAYRMVAENPEQLLSALKSRQYSEVFNAVQEIVRPVMYTVGPAYVEQEIRNGFASAVAIVEQTKRLEAKLQANSLSRLEE